MDDEAEKKDDMFLVGERERLTREALTDVDAGRVIDHHAVQVWADSLCSDKPLLVPR